MVTLCKAEQVALGRWNATSFVDLMRARDPLLLSDPKRASILTDSKIRQLVEDGMVRDGSSVGARSDFPVLWFVQGSEIQIHLSSDAVPHLHEALDGRLAHGRYMLFFGDRRRVTKPNGEVVDHAQTNVAFVPEDGPSRIEEREGIRFAVVRVSPLQRIDVRNAVTQTSGSTVVPSLPGVRFIVVPPERLADPRYPW
jgi:hypothetical protein